MLLLFILIAFVLFSMGIGGIASTRHFIMMINSIEIIFIASTLLAAAFFTYLVPGNIILLLLSIWSVASIEVIALIILYRYVSKTMFSLDVSKLSKLRD